MSVTDSIRIGTAGWTIPKAFTHEFPENGSHLERYAQTLNAVEINSSFYKPHQAKTYARWAAATPDDFRFALKLRKTLTHEKRLDVTAAELREVLEPALALGEKWEILLVQLPPSFEFKAAVAKKFFKNASTVFKGGIVCEPRHKTWLSAAAQKCFSDYGIGRVWADPDRLEHMPSPKGAPFYQRLHGSPQIYKSSYEPERLKTYANELKAAKKDHPLRWSMFDNTQYGFATDNAVSLTHMMSSKKAP